MNKRRNGSLAAGSTHDEILLVNILSLRHRRQLLHNPLHYIHRHHCGTFLSGHISPRQLFGSELVGTHTHTRSLIASTTPPLGLLKLSPLMALGLSPGHPANQVVHLVHHRHYLSLNKVPDGAASTFVTPAPLPGIPAQPGQRRPRTWVYLAHF